METKRKSSNVGVWLMMIATFVFFMFIGHTCNSVGGRYVKSYTTHSGKLVRGHVRKNYSSSATAYKRRQSSKSYYYRNPNRRKLTHSKK